MEIIIGDIHACYEEVMDLLDLISPSSTDKIISIGDLVDRGPDNRKTLELFTTNSQFSAIKGNHERKHLLGHQGYCKLALSQIIAKEELGDQYSKLLELVPTLPTYMELDSAILVHGSVEPNVPLAKQKEVVLLGSMSGQNYLAQNYDREWYELVDFEKPIIFGHKSYKQPFIYQDKVYGIDTNCCRGGMLTAITLPDFKIYSVKARADHWTNTRKQRISKPDPRIIKAYDAIQNLAERLRDPKLTRKELAEKIKQEGLPSIVFKAYDNNLTLQDVQRAYGKLPKSLLKE